VNPCQALADGGVPWTELLRFVQVKVDGWKTKRSPANEYPVQVGISDTNVTDRLSEKPVGSSEVRAPR
jgi:hypothetical protein